MKCAEQNVESAAKPVQITALTLPEHRRSGQASQLLCSAIVYLALAVIVLLAIPMCLFLGGIAGVWILTDKLIRSIERRGK